MTISRQQKWHRLCEEFFVISRTFNPAANVCSILFSLKILIKNGFFSEKLLFAYGQSEENQP
jgi:hypothetical protein